MDKNRNDFGFAAEGFESFCREQMERNGSHFTDQGEGANGSENDRNREHSSKTNTEREQNVDQLITMMNQLIVQNATLMNMVQQNVQSRGTVETNFSIMPDLSKAVEKFDGEKGPQVAKHWLQHIETSAVFHNWPGPFTYQMCVSNLTGAAKFWFCGRQKEITDWNAFRAAFKKTFIFEGSKTEKWKSMQERVQSAKENVSSYFYEKAALCRDLDLTFEETKEQILIGLWSKELTNFILSKTHEDEDSLYRDIVSFERIDSTRRSRIGSRKDEYTLFKKGDKDIVGKSERKSDTSIQNSVYFSNSELF